MERQAIHISNDSDTMSEAESGAPSKNIPFTEQRYNPSNANKRQKLDSQTTPDKQR